MNNKDLLSLIFEGCGVVGLFFFKPFLIKTPSTNCSLQWTWIPFGGGGGRGGEGSKRNQGQGAREVPRLLNDSMISKDPSFGLLWNENGPNVND